jgi:hypothetical protein
MLPYFFFRHSKRHPILCPSQFCHGVLFLDLAYTAITQYKIYRLPARRFFGPSSGTGNALIVFPGGGSCIFSIFSSISIFSFLPASPFGDSFDMSIRTANAALEVKCNKQIHTLRQ